MKNQIDQETHKVLAHAVEVTRLIPSMGSFDNMCCPHSVLVVLFAVALAASVDTESEAEFASVMSSFIETCQTKERKSKKDEEWAEIIYDHTM